MSVFQRLEGGPPTLMSTVLCDPPPHILSDSDKGTMEEDFYHVSRANTLQLIHLLETWFVKCVNDLCSVCAFMDLGQRSSNPCGWGWRTLTDQNKRKFKHLLKSHSLKLLRPLVSLQQQRSHNHTTDGHHPYMVCICVCLRLTALSVGNLHSFSRHD